MEGSGFPYWLLILCITAATCFLSWLWFQYRKSNNVDVFLEQMRDDLERNQNRFKESFLDWCTAEIIERMSPDDANHSRILELRRKAVNDLLERGWDEMDDIEAHVQELYPFPSDVHAQIEPAELKAQIKSAFAEMLTKASQ
jgi:hypothetical protein